MKKKHLYWILPLILVIGIFIGYYSGVYISVDVIGGMVEGIDKCCLETLTYAQEQNNDCDILIVGKMKECYFDYQD